MATSKPRKIIRKQSSAKLSTIAGRIMKELRFYGPDEWLEFQVRDIRALAASVLSQDETKGQYTPRTLPKTRTSLKGFSR